jgi:outer membrane protein assembly factor BamD
MTRASTIVALLVAATTLSSCGPKRPGPEAWSVDQLYAAAMDAYRLGRHARAIELFQLFFQRAPGDAREPEARYALGESHFARGDYLPAAEEFRRLVTEYPNHPRARAARFGLCRAYVRLSPRPERDPEYTQAAFEHCRAFADAYPDAPEATQARTLASEMRAKLARKWLLNAEFYARRRLYDAALLYYRKVVDDFADTSLAPTALRAMVDIYTRLGYNDEASQARERLLRDYPNSPEAAALRAASPPNGHAPGRSGRNL